MEHLPLNSNSEMVIVVSQDWNHRPGRIHTGPAADGVRKYFQNILKFQKNVPKFHTSYYFRYRFSPQFTQNVLAKLDPRDRKLTLDNFIVVSVQVRNKSLFAKKQIVICKETNPYLQNMFCLPCALHKIK